MGIIIDEKKCIGCHRCIDKCICAALAVPEKNENGIAVPFFQPERRCVKCMHCAIACPENAISYDGQPAIFEEALPIRSPQFVDDFKGFVRSRRSYRNFSDELVDIEIIREALELADWAPSAKNQHPTKYYIISGKEKIEALSNVVRKHIDETKEDPYLEKRYSEGFDPVLCSANTVIMAYARDKAINPQTDTAIALTYVEAVLQAQGIGTCWSGYLTRFANRLEGFKELCPLPEGYSFYGCLMVGYPTEEYFYIPERVRKAEITEL